MMPVGVAPPGVGVMLKCSGALGGGVLAAGFAGFTLGRFRRGTCCCTVGGSSPIMSSHIEQVLPLHES